MVNNQTEVGNMAEDEEVMTYDGWLHGVGAGPGGQNGVFEGDDISWLRAAYNKGKHEKKAFLIVISDVSDVAETGKVKFTKTFVPSVKKIDELFAKSAENEQLEIYAIFDLKKPLNKQLAISQDED